MIIMHHARLTVALTVMLTAGLIATLLPPAMAQKPASTVQPDLAVNEPENPHSLGYRTAGYGEAPGELVSSENQTWRATYLLWKEGISTSTSALGAVAPAHGRKDVLTSKSIT